MLPKLRADRNEWSTMPKYCGEVDQGKHLHWLYMTYGWSCQDQFCWNQLWHIEDLEEFFFFFIKYPGIQGNFLYLIKNIYKKKTKNKKTKKKTLQVTIILNVEEFKAFPLRSETRQGWPVWSLCSNLVLKVQSNAVRQVKEGQRLGRNKMYGKQINIWKDIPHRVLSRKCKLKQWDATAHLSE